MENEMNKTSYCATHGTYPEENTPCWACANPHIRKAFIEGKSEQSETIRKLREAVNGLAKVAHSCISHVGAANYPERQKEAHDELDEYLKTILAETGQE